MNENVSSSSTSILKSSNLSPTLNSSPLEKYHIDLPMISLESYPHMNETKIADQNLKPSSTSASSANTNSNNSSSVPFHDPLLNPPPSKVNEWPCGLMILVPLRLGLDRVNQSYIDV